ncbi:MAG: cation-transporting P-type ATPase [Proteobacteria bacterium]|nr:cation-transporting P-type ATPase [Pseudomonadota bacterium]
MRAPHARPAAEVLAELSVDPARGLGRAEARRRRLRFGRNVLRPARRRSAWRILADQFKSVVVWLLAAAAALAFRFGSWAEGVAIAVVLAVNGLIGFATELKAVRSMESLRRMGLVLARVRRAGRTYDLPAQALVPGDIVLVEGGDIVPADLRLIAASRLECDESLLTGESVPVAKGIEAGPDDAPLAERRAMAFKGSAVTRGAGEGVVVATGMAAEIGRIAALAEEAESEGSPIERRLDRLSRQLVWATIALAALIAGLGIATGRDPLLMIQTGIALAVAAVPEGLPIVATIALARGMWRMARRNALIERLSAVETLGATSVIFTDKTGTLTRNRMAVTSLVLAGAEVEVGAWPAPGGGAPFAAGGRPLDPDLEPLLRRAIEAAVLCTGASLGPGAGGAREEGAIGDPMEVALLVAGAKAGIEKADLLARLPEVREEAFDPALRMMATIHRAGDGHLVAVKGAPEAVLAAATALATAAGEAPLDEAGRQSWLARNRALAARGLRVLALAERRDATADVAPFGGLVLLGLVAFLDPPREDAAAAIAACRAAGVRVVMVTGDQAPTARAVAEAVGLAEPGAPAIEAREVGPPETMSAAERERLLAAAVFARVSPRQKLDLIALHQAEGAVVAMTGDGVNDAPALRKADIGVAMGRRGSQVAREAADMVLRDDAFATIVAAIEQGRVIFGNIRTFVLYLLSCNLSEILLVSLAAASGLPLPLLPLQILYLNLVTDVFPAFALGAGEGGPGIMSRPPRPPGEGVLEGRHWLAILGYGTLITAATLGAFLAALGPLAMDPRHALTVSFLTLALAQLWHAFNMHEAGSPWLANEVVRNPLVWAALGFCAALTVGAVHVPGMAALLALSDPGPAGWALIAGASLAPLAIGQALKARPRRRRPHPPG